MKLIFSSKEKRDILKSWIVISLAFGILLSEKYSFNLILQNFLISFATAGVGFLIHELAHKYAAQRYRYFAEFRADNKMLLIALVSSFFGFLFAAPGGVMIDGGTDRRKFGNIAAAGPLMNIIIAIIFLILGFFNAGILKTVADYGFSINSWLALFNLIPIFPFDGAKIIQGNKKIYFSLVVFSIVLMVITGFR